MCDLFIPTTKFALGPLIVTIIFGYDSHEFHGWQPRLRWLLL